MQGMQKCQKVPDISYRFVRIMEIAAMMATKRGAYTDFKAIVNISVSHPFGFWVHWRRRHEHDYLNARKYMLQARRSKENANGLARIWTNQWTVIYLKIMYILGNGSGSQAQGMSAAAAQFSRHPQFKERPLLPQRYRTNINHGTYRGISPWKSSPQFSTISDKAQN